MLRLIGARVRSDDGGRDILRNVSLEAAPGDVALLVGGSGSGKTTLLEAAAALRPLDAGRLKLAGEDVTATSLDSRQRRRIGVMFQDPEQLWLRSTVEEELTWPLSEAGDITGDPRDHAARQLDRVGLPPAFLDRPAHELSGGEQRLVALSASLTWEPDILFLDEPTAGLSEPWARQVIACIEAARDAGAAVIIATHELDGFLPVATRLVMLHKGEVVADGPPETVLPAATHLPGAPGSTLFAALHAFGLEPAAARSLSVEGVAEAIATAPAATPTPGAPLPPMEPTSEPPGTGDAPQSRRPLVDIPAGIVAAILVGLVFFLPAPLPLIGSIFAGIFVLAAIIGPGALRFAWQLRLLFVLAGFVAMLHLFTFDGDRTLDLSIVGVPPGGPESALRTVFRLVGPVAAGLLAAGQAATTTVARDLAAIAARIPFVRRLAGDIALATSIVLRLAPLLRGEVGRAQRAELARGVTPAAGGLSARLRRLVRLGMIVALGTLGRANRLAIALYTRGLTGSTTGDESSRRLFGPRDLAVIALAAMLLASTALVAFMR